MPSELKPFHLSFVVPDLAAARAFYQQAFGAALGRDRGSWIDLIFFGHQLTLHQADVSRHDGVSAMDHFGAILDKPGWESLLVHLQTLGIELSLAPSYANQGREDESGKFMLKDPAGNTLEFKYYGQFEQTVVQGKRD